MHFPFLAAEQESLELDALNNRTKESVEAADDRPRYHGDLCRPWRQVHSSNAAQALSEPITG
jgi:hypothetical protein